MREVISLVIEREPEFREAHIWDDDLLYFVPDCVSQKEVGRRGGAAWRHYVWYVKRQLERFIDRYSNGDDDFETELGTYGPYGDVFTLPYKAYFLGEAFNHEVLDTLQQFAEAYGFTVK